MQHIIIRMLTNNHTEKRKLKKKTPIPTHVVKHKYVNVFAFSIIVHKATLHHACNTFLIHNIHSLDAYTCDNLIS